MGFAKVDLVKLVAHDLRTAIDRLVPGELVIQLRQPTAKRGFGFRGRLQFAIGVLGHTFSLFKLFDSGVALFDGEHRINGR